MYEGKHSRDAVLAKRRRKRNRNRKAALVSVALAGVLAIGGTLAYLTTYTTPVENTFTPSKVTTAVDENCEGNVKKNVAIENTGDTTAYIRAAVVVTWQDSNGNVYGEKPVSDDDNAVDYDYVITYDLSSGWVKGADGFYYWTKPVKSVVEDEGDCATGVLITSCGPVDGKAPEGYSLNVEIIGSGIQSEGGYTMSVEDSGSLFVRAVQDAWSYSVGFGDACIVLNYDSCVDISVAADGALTVLSAEKI